MPRYYSQMSPAEKRAFTIAQKAARAAAWAKVDISNGTVRFSQSANGVERNAYNDIVRTYIKANRARLTF